MYSKIPSTEIYLYHCLMIIKAIAKKFQTHHIILHSSYITFPGFKVSQNDCILYTKSIMKLMVTLYSQWCKHNIVYCGCGSLVPYLVLYIVTVEQLAVAWLCCYAETCFKNKISCIFTNLH